MRCREVRITNIIQFFLYFKFIKSTSFVVNILIYSITSDSFVDFLETEWVASTVVSLRHPSLNILQNVAAWAVASKKWRFSLKKTFFQQKNGNKTSVGIRLNRNKSIPVKTVTHFSTNIKISWINSKSNKVDNFFWNFMNQFSKRKMCLFILFSS